jgi:hypothetical protein
MVRDPIPPPASRQDVLGQLRREKWLAEDIGETARVAELDRQIERLSAAGTATAPTRETAAAQPANRAHSAAAKPKPGMKPKPTGRNPRASAR